MIIELHAIQTFAPSNLNRDDTGNPKEALFGGVRRARISSQSAKRAMRVSPVFAQAINAPIGIRTKKLVSHVAKRLQKRNSEITDEWAMEKMIDFITKAKYDKKPDELKHDEDSDELGGGETRILLYISEKEIDEIAQFLQKLWEAECQTSGEKPDISKFTRQFVKKLKNRTSAPDIALFGRMLADNPELNIDAACQVAHAISTHEVNTAEFDYFTAVDDFSPEDTSGAGMLGLVAFNSATYYRCARIDWEQLASNLSGDIELAKQTVGAFMQAFACVAPSGMQNSFVNKHLPDFLLAVARPTNDGQSLANAFEQPVQVKQGSGYAAPSIKKLAAYWEQIESCFRLSEPTVAVLNPRGYELDSDELAQATVANLGEWAAAMTAALDEA